MAHRNFYSWLSSNLLTHFRSCSFFVNISELSSETVSFPCFRLYYRGWCLCHFLFCRLLSPFLLVIRESRLSNLKEWSLWLNVFLCIFRQLAGVGESLIRSTSEIYRDHQGSPPSLIEIKLRIYNLDTLLFHLNTLLKELIHLV